MKPNTSKFVITILYGVGLCCLVVAQLVTGRILAGQTKPGSTLGDNWLLITLEGVLGIAMIAAGVWMHRTGFNYRTWLEVLRDAADD